MVERLGEGRDGENVSNSPYCSRWMATRLAQELHGETRSISDLEEFPIPNLHTIRSDSIGFLTSLSTSSLENKSLRKTHE